jgi:hypothetical protein
MMAMDPATIETAAAMALFVVLWSRCRCRPFFSTTTFFGLVALDTPKTRFIQNKAGLVNGKNKTSDEEEANTR